MKMEYPNEGLYIKEMEFIKFIVFSLGNTMIEIVDYT